MRISQEPTKKWEKEKERKKEKKEINMINECFFYLLK